VPPKPTLEYIVVCDQARIEDNGKTLLIGVYGTAVVVDTFPAILPNLALLACMRLPKRRMKLRAAVRIPGVPEAVLQEISGQQDNKLGSFTCIINLSPCVLPEPGELSIEFSIDEEIFGRGRLDLLTKDTFKRATWT